MNEKLKKGIDVMEWLAEGKERVISRKLDGEPFLCSNEFSTAMEKVYTLRVDYQDILKEKTKRTGVLQKVEVNLYQCPLCRKVRVVEEY
jgi:hypothetical protein